MDESTVQKMSLLTPNIGMTYSGMGPDSRVLVRLMLRVHLCCCTRAPLAAVRTCHIRPAVPPLCPTNQCE